MALFSRRPRQGDPASSEGAASAQGAVSRPADPPSSRLHESEVLERPIGQLLVMDHLLDEVQVARVLDYQREHDLRFGEAVVALGMATRQDVLRALAQQFAYPYADARGAGLHRELFMANEPFSEGVEAFRDLRTHLLMTVLAATGRRNALAVVSPNIGDGKTFVASNLAVAFSQLPGRTLLVDADMRTPRVQDVFNVDGAYGLSTLLSGRSRDDYFRTVPNLPNLYVLPVGAVPPNPLELLQRSAFSLLMQELVSKFDHVIIDTPASAHGSDARHIATLAGAALIVSRRGQTRLKLAQTLLAQLGKSGVSMAGLLMNDG